MRISDWSSDVCSSDLEGRCRHMPTHAEQRVLPYRPDQVFDLVADIERYPEFLPWCVAARVRSRQENEVVADLVIGFKMIRERFTSRDRKSVGEGTSVSVRVDIGGRRIIKKKKK